jgi:hypothetical protein
MTPDADGRGKAWVDLLGLTLAWGIQNHRFPIAGLYIFF